MYTFVWLMCKCSGFMYICKCMHVFVCLMCMLTKCLCSVAPCTCIYFELYLSSPRTRLRRGRQVTTQQKQKTRSRLLCGTRWTKHLSSTAAWATLAGITVVNLLAFERFWTGSQGRCFIPGASSECLKTNQSTAPTPGPKYEQRARTLSTLRRPKSEAKFQAVKPKSTSTCPNP